MVTRLKLCLFNICFVLIFINNIVSGGTYPFRKISEKKSLTIFIAGDMMIGNRILPVVKKYGAIYPFKNVINLIKESIYHFSILKVPS